MAYQSSQYDYLLVLNIPLPIYLDNEEYVYVKTPSFEDYYGNIGYRRLEALFLTDINELNEHPELFGFIAATYLDIFIGIKVKLDMVDSIEGMELEIDAIKTLEEITGVEVRKDGIWINGVELSENDILEIRASYLMSLCSMNLDGSLHSKEGAVDEFEDEYEKRMREYEAKIKAIKGESESDGISVSPADQIKTIIYGLGMPIDDVRKLNQYGIREFYEIAAASPYDKVHQIAAGNGLLGKDMAYKPILPKENYEVK